jgi:hypothetical protein
MSIGRKKWADRVEAIDPLAAAKLARLHHIVDAPSHLLIS